MEEITGTPVIGVIPNFDEPAAPYGSLRGRESSTEVKREPARRHAVWMLTHPESAAAEAFRALRTSIMLSRPGGGPRIILITSCIPGEGKTTVTTNLAVAFAQHDKKVIIVEADMRTPEDETRIRCGQQRLGSAMSWPDPIPAMRPLFTGCRCPHWMFCPAGPRPPMPSEMLGSTAFDELLQEAPLALRHCPDRQPAGAAGHRMPLSISTKTDADRLGGPGRRCHPAATGPRRQSDRAQWNAGDWLYCESNDRKVAGYWVRYGYEYDNYGSYYEEKNSHEDVNSLRALLVTAALLHLYCGKWARPRSPCSRRSVLRAAQLEPKPRGRRSRSSQFRAGGRCPPISPN